MNSTAIHDLAVSDDGSDTDPDADGDLILTNQTDTNKRRKLDSSLLLPNRLNLDTSAQTPVPFNNKVTRTSSSSSSSLATAEEPVSANSSKKIEPSNAAEALNETVNAYIAQNGEVKAAQHFCKEDVFNKMLFMFFAMETMAVIASKNDRTLTSDEKIGTTATYNLCKCYAEQFDLSIELKMD